MKTLIFGYGITGKAVETFFKVKSKEYLIYDDNENVILDIIKELLFDDLLCHDVTSTRAVSII